MPVTLDCDDCLADMSYRTWTWTELYDGESFCLCPSCIERWNHNAEPERIRLHIKAHHYERKDAIDAISNLVLRWGYTTNKALEIVKNRQDMITEDDLYLCS